MMDRQMLEHFFKKASSSGRRERGRERMNVGRPGQARNR